MKLSAAPTLSLEETRLSVPDTVHLQKQRENTNQARRGTAFQMQVKNPMFTYSMNIYWGN